MKSISRSVLVLSAALLALSAVATASASAHEWLVNGYPVTTSTPVTNSGTITINRYIGGGGSEEVTCSVAGKGTVAAKGKGSVTEWKLTGCKIFGGLGEGCKEQKVAATAGGLPWETQILQNYGSPSVNRVFEPRFTWTCIVEFGGEVSFEGSCEGETANSLWGAGRGEVLEEWGPFYVEALHCKSRLGTGEEVTNGEVKQAKNYIKTENPELGLGFN